VVLNANNREHKMPEMNVEDFKFPDEKQESQEQEEQFEVEIEDDTPLRGP
jgi:exoribonuclease II